MLKVMNRETKEERIVYDIYTSDYNLDIHFLTFNHKKDRWEWVRAEYFRPIGEYTEVETEVEIVK